MGFKSDRPFQQRICQTKKIRGFQRENWAFNRDGEQELDSWYGRLLYDSERSGLKFKKARHEPGSNSANLLVENLDYELSADAIERALLLSQLHLRKGKSNYISWKKVIEAPPFIIYDLNHL